MLQPSPVEQLYGLLHERKALAGKLAGVQAALHSLRNNISSVIVEQYVHNGVAIGFREDLMKEEQTYERLLQALHDMQAQIEERLRPVAEQVVQAEVERLRSLSEQQKTTLSDCVAHIDQSILNCRKQMNEYRQTRSDLAILNERLANLGAEPAVIPDFFPTEDLADLILARMQGLRAEGKI
jgi:chromosome segregation ATPase